MAENEEETNLPQFGAPTPSVTIDMLETRPNTQILLDSVTPAAGEGNHRDTSRLDPRGGVTSRALSVASGSNAQESHVTDLLQHMDGDPFDEDQTELRFLHSKPTCFIILGKPGVGKTTLAKRLAQSWRCQMVNATELMLQHIDLQTDMGRRLQEILHKGGAVPEELAIKLIEDKINSPEVAHHGYVLDDFPSVNEEYMSAADQLEFVKNWKLKPDFIINLRVPDADLEVRRTGQRMDSLNNTIYTQDVWNPDKPEPTQKKGGDDEEEEEEEEEEEAEEEINLDPELGDEEKVELTVEIIERLVQRPEDLPSHAADSIKGYRDKLLKMFEDYMADHDQQYLIELDANKPAGLLFRELMNKLNTYILRRAAVPIRLQNAEEEDIPEDVETEELMRTLGGTNMVAPRYRWRRSKWARACPVELQKGNVVSGKPEFAVGFLDKIYVMSSPDAMETFLKNPRPYLVSPQPRPPCKLCVVGPPLSGKTSVCHLLAQKFNARVLDVNELIKSRMETHKAKQIELARQEALESAIATVKAKLREKEETGSEGDGGDDHDDIPEEKTPREKTNEAEEEETVAEEKDDGETTAQDTATVVTEGGATEAPPPSHHPTEDLSTTSGGGAPPTISQESDDVDENHPEVKEMVEAALKEAEKLSYPVGSDQYVDCVEEAVLEVHRELRKKDPTGPSAGGWIIDNFPQSRDHWTVLLDRGLSPDEVICLKDASDNGLFLMKRWYKLNKEEIDTKARERKEAEENEKARVLEEASNTSRDPTGSTGLNRIQEEREQEEMAKAAAEAAGEEEDAGAKPEEEKGGEGEGAGEQEVEPEGEPEAGEGEGEGRGGGGEEEAEAAPITGEGVEDEASAGVSDGQQKPKEDAVTEGGKAESEPATIADSTSTTKDEEKTEEEEEEEEPAPPPAVVEDPLPPDGPETSKFKDQRNEFEREWPSIQALLTGTINIEPIQVDIENRSMEDILKEAHTMVEQPYSYRPWEYSSIDMDEEDEDAAAEAEEEGDEMEEEEDEEVAKNKKKQFGDTKHFCPVAFKDNFVLWPGNPEIGAKYREKVYYCSTTEAREKFIADPAVYVAKGKPFYPPPVRLVMLGPKGAGKSLHARYLSEKLGLFHISFKDRLQELIIKKTKKKIGPEFEEEEEEPESEPEDETPKEAAKEANEADPEKGAAEQAEEGNEEGGEEEQEVELTDFEENVKGNLMGEESLSVDSLDKIVPEWWNMEPFKSTGFILEGFPRTVEEAQYMADHGLFPDAAVLLAVEDNDITDRLLPPKLDKWRKRRDRRVARREKRKAKKKKEREDAINKRRQELIAEADERKAKRQAELRAQRAAERDSDESEASEDEAEEDDEEEDIEAMLAEEFEEEEEEEEEEDELEEDAVERLKNEIGEVYDDDTGRLQALQETLEEIMIPRMELNGGRKPHIVRYTLEQTLRPIVEFRDSLFEKVYPVREHVARKMLQIGYKHQSRFGRWCPAKLLQGDCIQPMQGHTYPTFPAVYRQHIYFMSTPQLRDDFVMHPLKYLDQPSPKPVVPVRMAIIGPPKSGKTTLANRFASDYGMMRLSIGEAVRFVLMQQPKTELAKLINAQVRKGIPLPDELAIRALEVNLLDTRSSTRGYVLDGYPVTKHQVDLMTERSIIPVVVLELAVDSRELMVRGMKDRHSADRVLPLHDSAQILAVKIAAWQKEITAVREWYKEQHRNWVSVNGERSKWWVWNQATEHAQTSVRTIQNYLQRISEGKAASIADMCITPKEFFSRLGDFGQYCPVSLAKDGELVDCSVQVHLDNAAEFRGRYYKMENREKLEEFLARPELYVPPQAPRPLPTPDMLPKKRTAMDAKSMFPMQIELQGYCPVTYLDGKLRYEAIIPGDPEIIVEYRQKLYCFESEEKLQKFMRHPEHYYNLKLPHKLPPRKDPLLVTSLPMLGYMEQTISSAISKALTAVGCFKPKFPFVTPSRSALLYLAFHLKAYNPKSSEYVRKKYRKKLEQFEEHCELIRYLGDHMGPRYRGDDEKPIDFDHKMLLFLNLKGREPNPTTLVA
ncbi:adenylate kinase 9-like isoform X1 [Diadema setosum]|uniref:adenylate kinase 9-like isoform X1 n=1 Tax=Diadema setosum TaxID=31175 RepID=UPI003B3AE747